MNLTPPPPSQNSHVVRWHCTAESERRVAEIKSWFLCRRPTDQQACDRVQKGKRDPTHWLDPMTQRQLAEKCYEPGCLNISPSYEWLPLLLLNQLIVIIIIIIITKNDCLSRRPYSYTCFQHCPLASVWNAPSFFWTLALYRLLVCLFIYILKLLTEKRTLKLVICL